MKFVKPIQILAMLLFCSSLAISQTVVQVAAANGLNAAIDFANTNPGAADILELTDDGNTAVYELSPVHIMVPLTIRAAAGLATPPVIKAAEGIAENDFITVDDDLTVDGVIIDGQTVSGAYAQFKYMFKVNNVPDTNPINLEPELVVNNCHIKNVYQSGDPATATDGNFFDISRTSYAAKVHFTNTTLENCGDEAIRSINAHKDPVHPNGTAIGSLVIENCTFINVNGTCLKVESDGDADSYDGELRVENVTFYNCQRRVIWERDYANSTYRNLIIANSRIGNDTFGGTDALISHQRLGSWVSHVDTFNIEGIKANGDTVRLGKRAFVAEGGSWSNTDDITDAGDTEWTTVYEYDPMFADAANGDFTLQSGSPLYTLGHDGGALGDRRWATNPPPAPTVIQVTPSAGLNAAIDFANANPGAADVLELSEPGGVYELAPVSILVPMEIRGVDPSNPAIIKAAAGIAQNDYITVDNDLTLRHVVIDGQTVAGDYAQYKYMLKVNNHPDSASTVNVAPRLRVEDAHLKNVFQSGDPNLPGDGTFFDISRTSWAGSVHFERVTFENSGDEGVRSINAHKDPVHPNNGALGALIIRDCTFNNINGSAVKIESDADSLTRDQPVLIDHVTFNNCQRRVIWEREHEYTQMRNILIANSQIGNDTFGGTDALISFERRGSYVAHIDTFNIEGIKANGDTVVINDPFPTSGGNWSGSVDDGDVLSETIYSINPSFVDAANGDFRVQASALYTLGHDGEIIGDRRWADQSITGIDDEIALPDGFELSQNFPNPFNPSTTIRFAIPVSGKVKLQVYNVLGALVETLVDESKAAGQYSINWNASKVASGIYFYRLNLEGNVKVRKMMLLK